jgi:2-keto-4-pentenoate hydratase/2-oxohepta-3-ene-1,7-dioic acid hydratase in catechol pathway
MKLATFRHLGSVSIGVVQVLEGRVLDLAAAGVGFPDMLALIDAGEAGLQRVREVVAQHGPDSGAWLPLAGLELLAPLPQPRQMRDGMSFATHIRQSGAGARKLLAALSNEPVPTVTPPADIDPVYRDRPIYYLTNRMSVAGPESVVQWPAYSRIADYELELAVVIGRTGHDIAAADAPAYIFGYTIYNDFSARDIQMREMAGRLGPAKGKSFDGGNVLGPWIVTRDELPDPSALPVRVRINGEVRSSATTEGMLFSFPEIIAYVSQSETLYAGEVIGSGTVGNCCGLEIFRFLHDGDVIELEIDGIGTLRNRIAMPQGSAV